MKTKMMPREQGRAKDTGRMESTPVMRGARRFIMMASWRKLRTMRRGKKTKLMTKRRI